MKNFIGKWGWVSIDDIHTEHFKQYIHPKHVNSIEKLTLIDHVFQCLDIEKDGYLNLKSTETSLLLKQEVFRLMPQEPDFKPLQKVKFLNSKGFLEFGIVKKISWHNNEHKHIYLLEIDNKMKSRRYYGEDLQSNENLDSYK
ncbi:MAG: hypothetical protein MUC49_14545 [Raineya sp.]|nr:hypothetical protein [Raineya sp.]